MRGNKEMVQSKENLISKIQTVKIKFKKLTSKRKLRKLTLEIKFTKLKFRQLRGAAVREAHMRTRACYT